MQQGVPIYDATAYFGVSEKILRDVYGHHHPDHNKAVGEALSKRRRRITSAKTERPSKAA